MAIVFISPSRQLHFNWVEQWAETTIVHDVRFGPLFVWDNPVGENKSPLKIYCKPDHLSSFANAVFWLAFLWSAPCRTLKLACPDRSNLRLVDLRQ
jgi:hypothetical protein